MRVGKNSPNSARQLRRNITINVKHITIIKQLKANKRHPRKIHETQEVCVDDADHRTELENDEKLIPTHANNPCLVFR